MIVKVEELFGLQRLIMGWAVKTTDPETKAETTQQICPGFENESKLPEGIKRRARKMGKIISSELEIINKQLEEIREYKEEGKSEEELNAIREQKGIELLSDTIELKIEEMDFSKIEDITLEFPYGLLYDKIFKD